MGRVRGLSMLGEQLRAWRKRRGVTQLELAIAANSTPRYVSFVETGRSRPRRDMVLRLANALSVPLREQNAMLVAVGLRPEFSNHDYSRDELEPVRRIVDVMLKRHAPYPAWCWTTGLRVLDMNTTAERLFPGLKGLTGVDVVDFWCGSDEFRSRVENWREVLYAILSVLRREHTLRQSSESYAILERAQEHLGDIAPPPRSEKSVICPVFVIDGRRIPTMSAFMHFDTAVDATAAELRVELMFPEDDNGEELFRELSTELSEHT